MNNIPWPLAACLSRNNYPHTLFGVVRVLRNDGRKPVKGLGPVVFANAANYWLASYTDIDITPGITADAIHDSDYWKGYAAEFPNRAAQIEALTALSAEDL
jgi:hypothetical protein